VDHLTGDPFQRLLAALEAAVEELGSSYRASLDRRQECQAAAVPAQSRCLPPEERNLAWGDPGAAPELAAAVAPVADFQEQAQALPLRAMDAALT
jgi:hypothetical protein